MVLMRSDGSATINRKVVDVENGEHEASATTTTTSSLAEQIVRVLGERDSKWILGLIAYNIVIIRYLRSWVTSTNSIALKAYVNTIFFNVFALLVCLVSIWVEQNSQENRRYRGGAERGSIFGRIDNTESSTALRYPKYRTSFSDQSPGSSAEEINRAQQSNATYRDGNVVRSTEDASTGTLDEAGHDRKSIPVLGLEKYEVLALLVSSCLALVAGSLVSAEIVARLSDQPSVHTGRLGLGALLGFLAHLGTIIAYPDAGLNHVVCNALPCPTLKGCNPILGGNVVGAIILSGTHLVVHFWDIHIADTAAAFAVIGLTATSMLPLAFYTSNVMLRKLPRHMSEQLDRCIREALVIDGVLEFRNERFWTKSFGKLAGTLQVRIRRNANESHVLESVVQRLSMIVSTLTVREFREPRIIDGPVVAHPAEYYINEILPRDVTRRPVARQDRSSRREIDDDAKVVRIEDIIGVSDSQVETFAAQPEKCNDGSSSFGRASEKRTTSGGLENVAARTLTIYKNDNVRVPDRLYRGDLTKKNALLYGAKIDVDRFANFSVAEQNPSPGTNAVN